MILKQQTLMLIPQPTSTPSPLPLATRLKSHWFHGLLGTIDGNPGAKLDQTEGVRTDLTP